MKTVKEATKELIEWYWRFGHAYKGKYAVSASGWLYPLQKIHATAMALGDHPSEKPSFAVWGPSQVGKSTLLTEFIDAGVEKTTGVGSSLQWEDSFRIVFESTSCDHPLAIETPDFQSKLGKKTHTLALNPFNNGSDASSCVSRFQMADTVDDPHHPVELKLADRRQIIHALAMGFISECNHEKKQWDWKEIEVVLDKKFSGNAVRNREAYSYLCEVVTLLELLVETKSYDRYSKLNRQENEFRTRSASLILENAVLGSSPEKVDAFIAEIFWDNWAPITEIYRNLLEFRTRWLTSGDRSFCSHVVASMLLDMSLFSKATSATPNPDVVSAIRNLKCHSSRPGVVSLDSSPVAPGTPLGNPDQFALLQALVWEMIFPLKSGTLIADKSRPLYDLLDHADLLDFPGVSNTGQKGHDVALDQESLCQGSGEKLFSVVIKRGKTESIVVANTSNGNLHGMNLLLRAKAPIANPIQLTTGIGMWWKLCTGHDIRGDRQPIKMPFLVGLTFCGELVKETIKNLHKPLESDAFPHIHSVGDFSRIATYFTTNYERFCEISQIQKNTLEDTKNTILQNSQVKRLFASGDSKASLEKLFVDGGVSYFVEQMAKQAMNHKGKPKDLWESKRAECLEELKKLCGLHDPDVDDGQRRRELESIYAGLLNKLNGINRNVVSECAAISKTILSLACIEGGALKEIPPNLAQKQNGRQDAGDYLAEQISMCRNIKWEKNHADYLGINDQPRLQILTNAICDAVDLGVLSRWLLEEFGRLQALEDRRFACRFVAIKLADSLMGRHIEPRNHNETSGARQLIKDNEEKLSDPRSLSDLAHFQRK